MFIRLLRQRLTVAVALVAVFLALTFYFAFSLQSANFNIGWLLQAPAFIKTVAAAPLHEAPASIVAEAGISAYVQAPTPINLASVKSKFRTTETETADYLLGSVGVKGYTEDQDVHVYVHKDGWILAYYMAKDPTGKIFDYKAFDESGNTIVSTKLENTIANVLGAAGISFSNATYYDFRYPNATHMMLVVEIGGNCNDENFTIKLPGSFSFFERSWFVTGGPIKLNNIELGRDYSSGTLLPTQLPPDVDHNIKLTGCNSGDGGLVLVYKEQ